MSLKFYLNCGFQPPAETIAIAQRAETLGFAGIEFGDHLFYPVQPSTPYPYTESGDPPFPLESPWPDAWVLIGAVAAVTSRLHFRTSVYILALRHPLIVARALGTAAVISDDRVELGVGVGHLRDEFDALGADFHHRGKRTDEAIEAVRALLKSGPVSHHGAFWDLGPLYLHPAPAKPVPIFIGGESKAALKRTAIHGDGYISIPHTMDDLEALITALRQMRGELAPNLPPLRFHVHCSDAQNLGDYRRLADIGVEVMNVNFWARGRDPVPWDQRLERLEEFSQTVIERL